MLSTNDCFFKVQKLKLKEYPDQLENVHVHTLYSWICIIINIRYILFLETDTNETQKLRQDLDEVRMSILNLECNTNRKNEEINIDLNEWQIHKAKLEEIRPWLENAEKKINTDYIKPITLQFANDWLSNAQVNHENI